MNTKAARALTVKSMTDLSAPGLSGKQILYNEGIKEVSGIKVFRNKHIRFLVALVDHEGDLIKVSAPDPYGRKYIYLIRYSKNVSPVAVPANDIPEAVGKTIILSKVDYFAKEFNPVIIKQIQVNP